MTYSNIISQLNFMLAGEMLVEEEVVPFFNEVIDEINSYLDADFPGWKSTGAAEAEYTAFSDKYIRSVVIKGMAYKFYVMDEEGLQTAPQYGAEYNNALFLMLRDYTVPDEYQAGSNTPFTFDGVIDYSGELGVMW